ncbi:MAG: N-(5'-phosphoribosyl)anthranilate isomerase [Sulfolobaceae archaeon]
MVRLKICGNSTLSDIINLDKFEGVDYIGIIIEENSPRFTKPEFINIVKKFIKKPIVAVKAKGNVEEIIKKAEDADYIQIHRVLQDYELELLSSYYSNKKIILYVPADISYKNYLNKVMKLDFKILIDVLIKGRSIEVSQIRSLVGDKIADERVGVAGKIEIENIGKFLELEPGWIDISSSVEIYPGKKDINKIKKLIEVIKNRNSSNF